MNLDAHGRHADCCLTVHGPGLLDNRTLFLEQRRDGGRGEKGGARSRGMAEKNRDAEEWGEKRGERGREIALTIVQL